MFEQSLKLKEKMGRSWLIQRLHKPQSQDNPFAFGGGLKNGGLSEDAMKLLRGVMSFDYMGSAEFEFGAVPQTFRFLAEQSAQHRVTADTLTLGKHKVFYICPNRYSLDVIDRIASLYKDEYKLRLKERCGLKESLDGTKPYHRDNIGWLELDNGFMFFADKTMFEGVCKLFGLSPTANE